MLLQARVRPSPPPPPPGGARTHRAQIQCPVSLVDANLSTLPPEARQAAVAFLNYLYTPQAQREFTACGFR